jgi:hypothetical protein
MKKALLIFSLISVATTWGDTPVKDIKITGTNSQIASGSFAVKTGVTVTYESGSTLDTTAATVKVGTITGATNANVVVNANGTGMFEVDDTITAGTNQDVKIAPNGTGKLDLRAAPLKAGTATAGTAPLKFTAGTNLTTPENGAMEFDGSNLYITIGGVRSALGLAGSGTADSLITFTDITTNNVTSTKHGFAPKSPSDATQFLNGAATPGYAAVKDSDLATTDITTNNASTSKHGLQAKGDNNTSHFYRSDNTQAAVTDANLSVSDVTTNNATTSAHGFQKKLSGNSYDYAGGDGNYSIPSQIPLNTQNAAYTFVLTDAGKTIFHDEVTARVYTIPANASVAYPIGTAITIINNTSGGSITLSITSDTLRRGDGTAGTGSRTISSDSVVTIIKTKLTEWMITGKFS